MEPIWRTLPFSSSTNRVLATAGMSVGQILYGGDDLGGTEWDQRDWLTSSNREKVFWLAAEACLEL